MGSILDITKHGNKRWLDQNNRLHREDGPAVIRKNGTIEYYIHGQRHRLNGPAVILVGIREEYWVNGDRHRLNGPAVIWNNGPIEWWIKDRRVREKDHPFVKLLKQYCLFSKWKRGELTEDERVLVKMSIAA